MRSHHAFLLPLVFLTACTTAAKAPEPRPEPSAVTGGSPAEPQASAAKREAAIEKTYRSAIPICFDAALKVCRERDCVVRKQDRRGDESAVIAAQGRSFDFTLTFTRGPDNRTRVKLAFQGDSREEPTRFLDGLGQALLEPRD
jgi:hypothetical protein